MIYIADGTGPGGADYEVEMAGSHCKVIYHLNRSRAVYKRGPTNLDIDITTSSIADEVYSDVMRNEFPSAFLAPGERQSPASPIYLVGYSRGGAAVVMVAQKLAERGIPVAAMFLFDAVNRTMNDGLDYVPSNVEKCHHAIRNDGAQFVMEHEERRLWKKCEEANGFKELSSEFSRAGSGLFEDFLRIRSAHLATRFPELSRAVAAWRVKREAVDQYKVAMRNSFSLGAGSVGASVPFGNCATKHKGVAKWDLEHFPGTHGALGGVPWTTLGEEVAEMDRDVARRVWVWMSSRMLACGIRGAARR